MFESFLTFDITSLLIIAIFFLLIGYRPPWWSRAPHDCAKGVHLVPGPTALPVIGTTWLFFLYPFNRLHLYYQEMHEKYGAIMKEEFWGNIPVVNLFEKRDIVKVLKSGGKYPLRPPTEAVAYYRRSRPDRYASIGLVNAQGETWHHLRACLTPAFTSPKTISDFLPQVQAIADDWCNLLKISRTSTGRIENLPLLTDRLGLEITCALVLGRRMGFLLPEGQTKLGRNLAQAVRQHFVGTRDTYFGLPFWKVFPTPSYSKLVKSEEAIYDLAMELIDSANDSTRESPVFQSILKADVDEREKIAAIIDFIAAGIHTLKNSFLFLLHLIGQDCNIQKKIIQDDSLTYSKACLTESFRLLPTASALARILDEEMELSGYRVAAGTPVVCHFSIACQDESNFKNSKKFLPERWINEEKSETVNNSLFLLVPFGVGRRICPGKRFIEQIAPLLLKATVESFEIEADEELKVQYEFLLAPQNDLSMVFRDRV